MKIKKTNKSEKKVISKEMTFAEIIEKYPKITNLLFESGLHCIGCGGAMYETLEQGCLMHGFSEKEIDDLIKRMNKVK